MLSQFLAETPQEMTQESFATSVECLGEVLGTDCPHQIPQLQWLVGSSSIVRCGACESEREGELHLKLNGHAIKQAAKLVRTRHTLQNKTPNTYLAGVV
jgi:hypothetical protein